MSVKSSISLSESQDAFARDLVASGRYPSMSAVLQQGLELLKERAEREALEQDALRELLARRRAEPVLSTDEMQGRLAKMIDRNSRGT